MSLSEAKDETNENIEAFKDHRPQPSKRDMPRCGTGGITTLSTRARARSISGQKSKIPTNVSPVIRPGPLPRAQVEDNSRNLNATSTNDTTFGRALPINSGRFPTSKSFTTALSPPVTAKTNKSSTNHIGGSAIVKRSLENQFATRKKRYAKLKQELSAKQKNAADLYSEMLELREKMITSGTKDPGQIETINFTNATIQDPTKSFQIDPRYVHKVGEHASTPNLSTASEPESTIVSKIKDLSKACLEMSTKMLQERSKFLKSLTTFEDLGSAVDFKLKLDGLIETVKTESALLQSHLEEAKNLHELSIGITQKCTTLWNELELSRKKISQLTTIKEEAINKMTAQLDAAWNEKELAKVECERMSEWELILQTELQKLRAKIRGMEAKSNEDDLKIAKLQSTEKNFEMQSKSKCSSANTQLKDMEKNLKNSQSLLAKPGKEQNDVTREKEICNTALDERLAEYMGIITTLQRQKREIMEAINPAFLNNGKDLGFNDENGLHEKMIESLTKTMHELRLNSKVALEKNEDLLRRLAENDDLRFSVNELRRRNEELEIALNQKQLEIEEQDRVTKERRNAIKVRDAAINRDEVTNLPELKEAHGQQDREQADVWTTEKTENVQQLYCILEAKQVQIARLEQLVEHMEIQQERAQEQRTRLEKKIAQFQLAMHYKRSQGYVSPENHELSTTKISKFRKSCQQNNSLPLSHPKTFLSSLQASIRTNPRSSSRRAQCPSPSRPPCLQRSKSFNSFKFKTHSEIMDEVARALERERDYDHKKRFSATDEIAESSRKDRRTIRADYLNITEDEIRESFYNWLVEPWMFRGTPSNLIISSNDLCGNHWTTDCSPSATLSVRVKTDDRSRHRQRLTNDCSRERKCETSVQRRRSRPKQSCLAIPVEVQTKIHPTKNNSLRSRKKKS